MLVGCHGNSQSVHTGTCQNGCASEIHTLRESPAEDSCSAFLKQGICMGLPPLVDMYPELGVAPRDIVFHDLASKVPAEAEGQGFW